MKVWVVMGNDYPDSVHASEEAAELYIAKLKVLAAEEAQHLYPDIRSRTAHVMRIYWRHYEFKVKS